MKGDYVVDLIDVQPADRPSFALASGDGTLKLGLNPFKYSVFVHVLGKLYIVIIIISVLNNCSCSQIQMLHLQIFAIANKYLQCNLLTHIYIKKNEFLNQI